MEFHLKIRLGNEAMLTGQHLGHAIQAVGAVIIDIASGEPIEAENDGVIRDVNGARVGEWSVVQGES